MAIILSVLLVLTTLSPFGVNTANAAAEGTSGGGITLQGFSSAANYGKSTNPHMHYESTITLDGTYGSGIVGENLRLRIVTNNGDTIDDLNSTKPAVDTNTFSFSFNEIDLKPGMNRIDFYESSGDVTKDLLSFYVQYNNTPVLSELEVDDVDLISDPTVIRINSSNNPEVTFTGKAVNADSVKITNKTTNKVFTDDVSASGTFALDVEVILGLNEFDIVAYNSSREVGLKQRSIVVTLSGGNQGDSDQFFGVKLNNGTSDFLTLEPGNTPVLSQTPPASIYVKGTGLFYAPSSIELFKEVDPLDNNPSDGINTLGKTANTLVLRDLNSVTSVVYGTPEYKNLKTLSGNYLQYDISTNTPVGAPLTPGPGFWVDGHEYELKLTYYYVESATVNGTLTKSNKGPATVKNYSYKFKYVDPTSPRIDSITNVNETKQIALGVDTVNPIRVSPLDLKLNGANLPSGYSELDVYFNDNATPKTSGTDYTYNDLTQTVTLNTLPPGETKVKLVAMKPGKPDAVVEFIIKPEIAPFVSLSYVDGTTRKFIDSSWQITDLAQVKDLDVKVTNYTWNNDGNYTNTTGDKVFLNGVEIAQAAPNSGYHTLVTTAAITAQLKQGRNTLKIELQNVPNAVFTYTIYYSDQKLPTVENIKLQVEQNKDDIELEKKSGSSSYETSAFFLSEFTFDVKNASNVQVLKDGKTIASYQYVSGAWVYQTTDTQKAEDDAAKGNTDLVKIFEDRNFPNPLPSAGTKDNTFTAKMTSKQYGDDLLDELESISGLKNTDIEERLKLFPLTLAKGGTTNYEIVVSDGGVASRHKVSILQQTNSWTVLYPTKLDNAPYAVVNTNSVPIKIFAENATKVMFGKVEAVAHNTDKPDFEYNETLGKSLPKSYYVFEANVPLKPGLNKVKYSVIVGSQTYTDEVEIYNVNSTVSGAESRDVLGKKLTFSVFEKALELKFPSGTVLLAPMSERQGNDVKIPSTDIFTDVPIYFGIADRTTGQVYLDDSSIRSDMEDILELNSEFNYASPLYYIDAGNAEAGSIDDERQPGGRDPYFEGEVNGKTLDAFIDRWKTNLVPSKQGTLTLKYDSSIVNAANTTITVFYNNGDEWANIGGVVNTSKKAISVPFKGFGYYMVMKTRETFTDVIFHDFARDSIETLFAKGIMMDAPGSGFGTELKISRGEFTTMIVKALDLPINAGPYEGNDEDDPISPTFRDVRPSGDIDWKYQYKYIETAARAGIVRGKDTTAFFPDDSLTREEAAIIIARALNLKLTGSPEAAQANLLKMFTDGKDIGYYAATSVLAVTKAKLMNGEPNDATAKKPTYRFLPRNDLSRAEMAVITVRVMVQLKKLPKQ